jgi:hypothetical protein
MTTEGKASIREGARSSGLTLDVSIPARLVAGTSSLDFA